MKLQSYVAGQWREGDGAGVTLYDAVTGKVVCEVSSAGLDFAGAVRHGREQGSTALREMTFHDRAAALKAMAKHLMSKKEDFYALSAKTGASRADGWIDIEGGIGTVFSYASLVTREFPNDVVMVEGEVERLSAKGTFLGRHILSPKPGVAVHINAYNFPCWGMLEKIAPSLAAGMPVIVKPATPGSYLTEAMVREMIAGEFFPEGAIQLICGSAGDLLDHLGVQDVVTFTGSASTGHKLRTHPNIVANSIPFTMEADSLNCAILGKSVEAGDEEFDLFIKEVAKEMTTKAGQKCTAIRRVIVPSDKLQAVADALQARLAKAVLGDPSVEGVRMGPLIGRDQAEDVQAKVDQLAGECEVILGGAGDFAIEGADNASGAFYPATLLRCDEPFEKCLVHEVEAFGPVSTLMPYDSLEDAISIAQLGKGSLVGSLYTYDDAEARRVILATAPYHGRMLILNRDCAAESHYMQRTALQGSPTTLMAITGEYHAGARVYSDDIHPFKKYFEDLTVGETLITHRRTVTEADIVNFGCISGDHFYAHFDEIAAKDSFFGKRVAHGYFVISAAAGMFVEPSPGPVIANYGLENLRFIEPVAPGDTIRVKLSVKRKIKKAPRGDEAPNGVVVWAIEVTNQREEPVAVYDILTLVSRREA
jgi:oxepin-CoA hydrolase/3-oxo-5,6-dehydrosuberyl-CoA semialdehyde dehydrogenase